MSARLNTSEREARIDSRAAALMTDTCKVGEWIASAVDASFSMVKSRRDTANLLVTLLLREDYIEFGMRIKAEILRRATEHAREEIRDEEYGQ